MIQSLTKPEEGETAAESIQIALAASAPNGSNTLIERYALNFGPCRYILFVTVVTSWWLGITFGNAAYFAVITFTTVGLGDFAPPFLHHDTTYADVVGQYLLFAASSLLGLVLLALLLKALDELLQKRLSKGIDRVAAGVLAMRRRYSSDGSRGRRRGRRASGGSRDDSRASSSTSA